MPKPKEWQEAALEDIVESLTSGQSPNCYARPAKAGEWGILKTTAITWEHGWSPKENKAILPNFSPRPEYEVKSGDILITKAGPRHRVGVVTVVTATPPRLMVSGKMTRIRIHRQTCDPVFIANALASCTAQHHLVKRTTGMAASQTNFTHKALLKTPLLLPTLPEQRKIAAILSSVDATIEKTEAVVEQLQVVKKAIMQELLTRGLPGRHTRFRKTAVGEVPKGWEVCPFEKIASVDTGFAFRSSDFIDPCSVAVPIVRMSNLREGVLELDDARHVHRSVATQQQRFALCDGDFLVGLSGSLGNFAWVRAEDLPCYLNQRVGRIRPRCGSNRLFVAYTYLSERIQGLVQQRAAGLAQANVSPQAIREFLVAVPKIEEQEEIASCVSSIDRRLAAEQHLAEETRNIKTALMTVLLSGEVRVTPEGTNP